jgi:hypothetical protein
MSLIPKAFAPDSIFGRHNTCHRLRISGASHYERGALQTLVTHALSLILAGEDIRMRALRRER